MRSTRTSPGSAFRGELPVRRQSEHLDEYAAALKRLAGCRADPIRASRHAVKFSAWSLNATRWGPRPRDPDGTPLSSGRGQKSVGRRAEAPHGAQPVRAASLDTGASHAADRAAGSARGWRRRCGGRRTPRAVGRRRARPQGHADKLLAILSVVVDDALQGITHVVRGRDLLATTSIHRLLQVLLDLPSPTYHHHRLVLDAHGRKLAKSTGAASLRRLRDGGATPADIRRMVGLA